MGVFPTAYFAPIAYFHYFTNDKNPIIDVKEHFVKQTIRTRCEILGPNGKQLLSIPVERIKGNKTAIEDLKIVDDGWNKIHWKSIETAYSSAPFFDHYGIEIKKLIDKKFNWLIDLNTEIHQRVLDWLDISQTITFSSEYIVNPEKDFRSIKLDSETDFEHTPYHQVFRSKENCLSNLSILDLILNQGPMARKWLISE